MEGMIQGKHLGNDRGGPGSNPFRSVQREAQQIQQKGWSLSDYEVRVAIMLLFGKSIVGNGIMLNQSLSACKIVFLTYGSPLSVKDHLRDCLCSFQ